MDLAFSCFVIFFVSFSAAISSAQDPDEGRTFEELVTSRGFNLQVHSITTEDGYILTLHRVVQKSANFSEETYSKNRKPVIVQHGLFGASSDFFINSPFLKPTDDSAGKCGDNFGFCLVLTGRYDIWLPNSRGNGYSNGHTNLTTSDTRYWDFTFEQMAFYDTPAAIDFVQKTTGHSKVGYIGFSQGSSIMFALLSMQPEYSEIIEPFISWAPPIYVGHMTSKMRLLSILTPMLQVSGGMFDPTSNLAASAMQWMCGVPVPGEPPCIEVIDELIGQTSSLNQSRISVYFSFFPATVSNLNLVHFSQLYDREEFTRYDYGLERKNLEMYGTVKVPLFSLENISPDTKIAILRGNTDAFVTKADAEQLLAKLRQNGNNVIDYQVPSKAWNHLDFIAGTGAGKLVYDPTIQILDQFM